MPLDVRVSSLSIFVAAAMTLIDADWRSRRTARQSRATWASPGQPRTEFENRYVTFSLGAELRENLLSLCATLLLALLVWRGMFLSDRMFRTERIVITMTRDEAKAIVKRGQWPHFNIGTSAR
jgi:hypothetical protein